MDNDASRILLWAKFKVIVQDGCFGIDPGNFGTMDLMWPGQKIVHDVGRAKKPRKYQSAIESARILYLRGPEGVLTPQESRLFRLSKMRGNVLCVIIK